MIQIIKNPKILTAALYDMIVAFASFYCAICLRFETLSPFSVNIQSLIPISLIIISCQIVFFNLMGLYRGMWRFSSTTDLVKILKAVTYGTALSLIFIFLWNRLIGFPRSVLIIDYALLVLSLGGGRFLYRVWKDAHSKKALTASRHPSSPLSNVLIIGAGTAANQLVKEIESNTSLHLNVCGFLDDNPHKIGRSLQGYKVIGKISDLPVIIEKYAINKVFIAIPSATGEEMKNIIHVCKATDVEFKTLPKLNEILSGKIELSLLRNINLEDLLGRDPITLDQQNLKDMIYDNCIMITGAGGSIGSELCKQVSLHKPQKVILFEMCELFLYQLELNLKEEFPEIEFIPYIGDVRFKDRVNEVVKKHKPASIFHAAAYKHVPMMESNPLEAIFTNILGTKVVAESALENHCSNFVMISTDKAVNPTNIMGSTKRIAEMVCQNLSNKSNYTKFTTVRFGNVLGSNGSVIPLFKKQIEQGGPVTITHPDITRFFMSIPEACQLVLQAASMSQGGEIFVLDMGTPVKIIDLAKDLISLSGLKPDVDIKLKFTGLRPGEKLYEELFSDSEILIQTSHEKVRIAHHSDVQNNFDKMLEELLSCNNSTERIQIYKKVKEIVTEFTSSELDSFNFN